MFAPEPIEALSSEEVHEMFIWLDDLRDSGLVNIFGASPLLAEAFTLDAPVARKVWAAWSKTFSMRHGADDPKETT
jgi:hypothetical protein